MAKRLVIGVDSSTTACKAIAWDRSGSAIAAGRATYPLLQPKPSWYEQNAQTWWRSICVAFTELLDQIDAGQIDALCITHQRESFVPVDLQAQPLRNAILWLDERSRAQISFLEQTIGADRLHQITGKPLSMTQSLPKMVWLAQNEPDIIARTHKFLDVHGFLIYGLTGAFRTSQACADPMGLVDMQGNGWAESLIDELGFRVDQFPELVPPGVVIGHVNETAATATGLPSGLPIVAGAGDGQCAGLGANAIGGGRAYLNLGTAVVSGAFSTSYLTDKAFRTMYAPVAGAYFLETVLRGGVFTISWFVEKFAADLVHAGIGLSPEETLEAAAAKVPPGSLGLMLVPYWSSVMSPYWDPQATGITIGWTGAHGREHFYRAILEGVAFEQRLVGDAVMAAMGASFSEYVTMGGGSQSGLWCQIVADICGVPVLRSTTTEATCLGAGILAAAAAGWFSDAASAAEAMTDTSDRFTPEPEMQARYEPLYTEVYKTLFPTVQPLVDRLTGLTHNL
jgi:xylulokinase